MTDAPDRASTVKRRTVIQGVGLVGGTVAAGGLLAACGGGGDGGGSDTATSAPPQSDAITPSAEATTDGGAPATGTELGSTSDVPVGGGRVYESEKVLVAQPTEGEFKAFSSVCTHQGCAVSMIEGTTMTCPCHGSEFSTDGGKVLQGPATKALPGREVRVEGDAIFLV
ncbi:Rieske (2Fe-2S) protein [Mumia sp. ZJ1417]|uniref:Rieske (2Fe-2S) protein n=1 Tax=Mumia sp. ZJ1417 TaxID=2708082 RepID=UPI0014209BAD|nr:Rieske (2Fe-2S) protein [Mumia sp. ZJ1417]QMW64781.1 Rieske (2Fe-2S) protein [Mumia sp. ZJ1417]